MKLYLPLIFIFSAFSFEAAASEAPFQKAADLIHAEKFTLALKVLNQNPPEATGMAYNRLTYLKGICYSGLEKWEEAKSCFISIKQKYAPLEDYIEANLIKCDFHQGLYKEALRKAIPFPANHPLSRRIPEVRLLTAKSHIALHQWEKARVLLRGMLNFKAKKNSPEIYFLYYTVLHQAEKKKEAYETLQKIHYYHPNSREADASAKLMKKLREDNPKVPFSSPTPNMIYLRLVRLFEKGKYKQSLAESLRVMSDPAHPESLRQKTYSARGRGLRATKDYVKAAKLYNDYIKKYPKGPKVAENLYHLARIHWNLGNLDKAISTGVKLKKKYPKSRWAAQAYRVLGGVQENRGNRNEAIKYYREILKISSQGMLAENAAWRIAWNFYLLNDHKKALAQLTENVKKYPLSHQRGRNLFWAWRCAKQLNKPDLAADFYSRLLETDPFGFYGILAKTDLPEEKSAYRFLINSSGPTGGLRAEPEFNATLKTPSFSPKASWHLEKAEELTQLALFNHAHEELRPVYKEINRKKLEDILWIGQLFYKARAYKRLLPLLNRYLISLVPKDRSALPDLFWQLYYPPVYMDMIVKASTKYDVDPFFALGLIRQESSFDTDSLSSAGAIGLMQLIPKTGQREFKKVYPGEVFSREILFNPALNINLGIYHLSKLIKKNRRDMVRVLIGYNAGMRKASSWKRRFSKQKGEEFIEMIPYGETKRYVKKVLRNYYNYQRLYGERKGPHENPSVSFKKF